MPDHTMPEPADSAIVEVVELNPARHLWFQRDDTLDEPGDTDHWYSLVPTGSPLPWEYLQGDEVARWYRANDPEIAVIPKWRGFLGWFTFRGRNVAVTSGSDEHPVRLQIDGPSAPGVWMSCEQAERLGIELIAAARAKGCAS